MSSDLKNFDNFLGSIDVDALRAKYKDIKIVEPDMPKKVQALSCLYGRYWDKRTGWPQYEDFYKIYKSSLSAELEEWRQRCRFSEETFYLGLPARIYRTWASILTQIQGAYVAESICGKGKVEMGVNNDYRGKDIVVELGTDMRLPLQIKKLSARPEAKRVTSPRHRYIQVDYAVPPCGKYTKGGEIRIPYKRWEDEWGDRLEALGNGFVLFKKEMFGKQNLLRGIIE